jgi:hypothetical protein
MKILIGDTVKTTYKNIKNVTGTIEKFYNNCIALKTNDGNGERVSHHLIKRIIKLNEKRD